MLPAGASQLRTTPLIAMSTVRLVDSARPARAGDRFSIALADRQFNMAKA
jgi:hypothetical protein